MSGATDNRTEDQRIDAGLAQELRATINRAMQLKQMLINRGWDIRIIVNGVASPQVEIMRTQKL